MTRHRQATAVLLLVSALAASSCTRVKANAAFKDGNKAYREENFKRAAEYYTNAVTADPNFAEAWFYLGSSRQAMFRPGKDNPENVKHLEDAIQAFKQAIEANPQATENQKRVRANALGALTGIYSEDPFKSYDDAIRYAQLLVQDNPDDARNLYAIAALYEKFNKVDEAEQTYRKVVELNPNDARACGALAAFFNKTYWDEQGVVVAGTDAPGRAKFELAIETLQRCASLDPNNHEGYLKVATFYWDKAYRDPSITEAQKDGFADKGLEAAEKALQLNPLYFEAMIYKGLLYREKAKVTRSPRERAEFLDKAAELQKQALELKKQQAEEAARQQAGSPPTSGV